MDDRNAEHDSAPTIALGLALAQLPLEAPDHDAWPLLSRRLAARRRAPRWPMAVAASLLVGLLAIPFEVGGPAAPSTATPSTASAASTSGADAAERKAQLAALMAESQRLERLVAAVDQRSSSATAAAMSLEYEDGLHAIDGALEAAVQRQRHVVGHERVFQDAAIVV